MLAALLLAQILGAAFVEKPEPAVLTWGERIQRWTLDGRVRTLAEVRNGPGGCAGPDGTLYLEEAGGLVRRKPPYQQAEVVEKATEFADCLPASLFGRTGVLLLHFFSQLRFYQEPAWDYRELYSIYTASRQGALVQADIDGDGRMDLFAGNYAMLNPGRIELPWRLHAVNLWHEQPDSARARIAVLNPHRIVWAESESAPARVAIFDFTGDFRQTWRETRLPGEFRYPRGVAYAADSSEIIVGDETQVRAFDASEPRPVRVWAQGFPTLRLWAWRGRVLVATPSGVRVVQRPRR